MNRNARIRSPAFDCRSGRDLQWRHRSRDWRPWSPPPALGYPCSQSGERRTTEEDIMTIRARAAVIAIACGLCACEAAGQGPAASQAPETTASVAEPAAPADDTPR